MSNTLSFSSFALIIPTHNAGDLWESVLVAIQKQSYQPQEVVVIDTESQDKTNVITEAFGYKVTHISKDEFDHALTRHKAVSMVSESIEFAIFMTQDVLLKDNDVFKQLLKSFDNPDVGMVFGRQVAHKNATPIEIHARLFNYPETSYERRWEDRKEYGIKSVFCSDAFSALRLSAYFQVGGFSEPLPCSEDTYICAKLLKQGWKLAYKAEAVSYHSHCLSLREEIQRYIKIGKFHGKQPWILQEVGAAEGEGIRFVKSELRFLWYRNKSSIPFAVTRTLTKWLSYKLSYLYFKKKFGNRVS